MAGYVSKDVLYKLCEGNGTFRLHVSHIDQMKDADVAPVVHGRWVHLGGDEWACSSCGFVICTDGDREKPSAKYCQGCGAKMDLKEASLDA